MKFKKGEYIINMVHDKLDLKMVFGKELIKGKICNISLTDVLIDTGAVIPALTDKSLFNQIKTKELVQKGYIIGGFGGDGKAVDIWKFESIQVGSVIFPHVRVICDFRKNLPSLILPWGAYFDGICNFNFAERTVVLEKPNHVGEIRKYITEKESIILSQSEEKSYINLIISGMVNGKEVFRKKDILDKVMNYLPNNLNANENDLQEVIDMLFLN